MTQNQILKTVCDILVVDSRDVLQPRVNKGAGCADLVFARNLFMYFAKEYKMGSLYAIGRYVNRDHATTIHAIRTIKNDIETDRRRLDIFCKVKNRLIEANESSRFQETGFDYPSVEISPEVLMYQHN
jgi:chromosomal replication initiation ATPase DnaA